jgi:hypothetical protein
MIFDREGYSPEFFQEMWEKHRISCQTYRKEPNRDWPEDEFEEKQIVMPGGEEVTMKLAERGVRFGDKFWMREIRKLTQSGHQTTIISSVYSHDKEFIGMHMFSRWSQENFFRYMMLEFAIDKLIDYNLDSVDETKEVVNPSYRAIESAIKSKTSKRSRNLCKIRDIELKGEDIIKYERQKGDLKEEIDLIEKDINSLKEKRKEIPKHIAIKDLPESDRFKQLSPVRKQFIDTIKMISYRCESSMAQILREIMSHSSQARSLLKEIFTTEADLIPDEENGTLTVRLHNLTNRSSDESARFLAKELNASETKYPGTNLRLVYEMVSP